MKIYNLKMYLKRIPIVAWIVKKKKEKSDLKKMNDLRQNGLIVLKDIESLLSNSQFIFFVDFGTLLGAVRNNDLIKWDNDIDFGLLYNDHFSWEDFETILNKIQLKKIRQFVLDGQITEQTYRRGHLTIDFFLHVNNEQYSQCYGYYRKEGYIYNSMYEYHTKSAHFSRIEKPIKGRIRDIEVSIPGNAEEYLESVYTSDWRIPNPKWSDLNNYNRFYLDKIARGDFFEGNI